MASSRDKPKMFRFTIRDVLWLMVVVGVSCAWLLSRQREAVQRAQMEEFSAQLARRSASSALTRTLENELSRERTQRTILERKLEAAEQKIKLESHYPIFFPPAF